MKLKVLTPNIYAVEADTTQELAKLFLRFQENYESPQFRNKIFSLPEFKTWYKESRNSTKFTYYDDWSGFNVPSSVIRKFQEGKFDPLSQREKWLLKEITKVRCCSNEPFYVLGYKKGSRSTLKHEMAHAKFFTNYSYRADVLEAVYSLDPPIRIDLHAHLEDMGYHEAVVTDEIHAYVLCEKSYLKSQKLWNEDTADLKVTLDRLFKEHK